MTIRTGGKLLDRLGKLLQISDAADIAVAWATSCPAVDALRSFCARGGELRIVVGVDSNISDPWILWDLHEFAQLRIADSPGTGGIFHPKFYCFRRASRPTLWIGSANLTRRGFSANTELMLEGPVRRDAEKWFDELWSSLDEDPAKRIKAYERDRKANPVGEPSGPRTVTPRRKNSGRVVERLDPSWTWEDFVDNLWAKDEEMLAVRPEHADGKPEEPWSAFGDEKSYLATISAGKPIMRMSSWRKLESRKSEILLGRAPWGALGTLGPAGKATRIFISSARADVKVREDILRHVQTASHADTDVIRAGLEAVKGIGEHYGFGKGVATRLLALARADRYVSVNGASCHGLAACSGLPYSTLGTTRYGDLLEWVHDSTWYKSPQPKDAFEREIWDCRAALIDAFVYDGV